MANEGFPGTLIWTYWEQDNGVINIGTSHSMLDPQSLMSKGIEFSNTNPSRPASQEVRNYLERASWERVAPAFERFIEAREGGTREERHQALDKARELIAQIAAEAKGLV